MHSSCENIKCTELYLYDVCWQLSVHHVVLCGSADAKPVVNCSFVTEFEDHIFVAMDAEAVLFIHDLVINYVKEKDQGMYCVHVYRCMYTSVLLFFSFLFFVLLIFVYIIYFVVMNHCARFPKTP